MTIPFLKPSVTVREKAFLARQLSTMLSAGIHLPNGLSMIADQVKNNYLKQIIRDIVSDLNRGLTFSAAIGKHPDAFDLVFSSIVKSGEVSGKLDQVMNDVAGSLERQDEFQSSIKGALAYPLFIVVVMIGVAILMSVKVIPQLKKVFEEAHAELPWSTRFLVAFSDSLIKFWYLYLIAIVGLFALAKWWSTTPQGLLLLSKFKIKNPTGIGLATYMARFTETLAMLTKAGVPIIQAVNITAQVLNNEVYRRSLAEIASQLERGIPMSIPVAKDDNFPPLVAQMLTVGEQTGQIDQVMDKLAAFYEDEASRKVKTLSRLFEPAMIVVIGIGVAFIVFSILLPIYNIAQLQ